MEDKKCSVLFTGSSGLIFTSADGVPYKVNAETTALGMHDRILFSNSIRPLTGGRKINAVERELIVSKILEQTKDVKWLIQ